MTRPQAPDLFAVPEEPELTPPSTPLALLVEDAIRRFEKRLPALLKPLLDAAAATAAVSVINALGGRLNAMEGDVRLLQEWRDRTDARLEALERGARHSPTIPSPPPEAP